MWLAGDHYMKFGLTLESPQANYMTDDDNDDDENDGNNNNNNMSTIYSLSATDWSLQSIRTHN